LGGNGGINLAGSSEVNKAIRKIINRSLRENGFSIIKGRTAWGYHNESIWVFNIRAVGAYHSAVTGWPPASLVVSLGICYTFFPEIMKVKKDENGIWYPKEWQCHRRAQLTCSYSQLFYTKEIKHLPEKIRNDIWWILPDDSNVLNAVSDINDRFLRYAVKWFNEKSNKESAIKEITNFKGMHYEKIEK
jgi:hypothetical protein